MTNKSKAIAITGAAGFIGSHLCKRLLSEKYKVIGIDDLSKGSVKNLKEINKSKNFTFYKLDITKSKKLLRFVKEAEVIVHLAAAKIPRYGNRLTTLLVNTEGTKNILEIAKITKAKVIFASTSDVYGKNTNLPFKETTDLVLGSSEVARWAYAVSKIFDEHLYFAYSEAYGIPFVIIRFFGVYGPSQHRSWYGGPQSLFIDALLENKPLEIHGDGLQKRSFIYIDDAIDAIIKFIESEKVDNQIFNIGSKEEISVINLARLIAKIMNKKLQVKKVPYKSFTGKKYEDVRRRLPDLTKIKKTLNWTPKISLHEGLTKTIEWYKNNPK